MTHNDPKGPIMVVITKLLINGESPIQIKIWQENIYIEKRSFFW
jgi:hypothetical protein